MRAYCYGSYFFAGITLQYTILSFIKMDLKAGLIHHSGLLLAVRYRFGLTLFSLP